ncbi:MAG: flagellar motor protein MotB, partial [Sphingomonadales bacterium]
MRKLAITLALATTALSTPAAGYDVDMTVGYDFGGFRAEAEVGYRKASVIGVQSTVTLPNGAVIAPAGNYPRSGGSSSALSFMVNGMFDFGDDDGVQAFVGGGVGVARVKSEYGLRANTRFINDSDTVFAYQGIAGIRAPLSDSIDVSLKYRFFSADGVTLVDALGRRNEGRFRSHSILGGLTFNFGAPEEVV